MGYFTKKDLFSHLISPLSFYLPTSIMFFPPHGLYLYFHSLLYVQHLTPHSSWMLYIPLGPFHFNCWLLNLLLPSCPLVQPPLPPPFSPFPPVASQALCRPWTKLGTSWKRAAHIFQTLSPPRQCAAHPAPPSWRENMCIITIPIPTTRTAPHPRGRPTTSRTPLLSTSTTQATGQVSVAESKSSFSHTHWVMKFANKPEKEYIINLLRTCSSLSLFWKIPQWVQRLLRASWLEGVGSIGEKLTFLQLHPLQKRCTGEAQQRLHKGIIALFWHQKENTCIFTE